MVNYCFLRKNNEINIIRLVVILLVLLINVRDAIIFMVFYKFKVKEIFNVLVLVV